MSNPVNRAVGGTRFVISIASVATFALSLALLLAGVYEAFSAFVDWFKHPDDLKHLLLGAIEAVDIFLLATVLYVVALGLWELFVDDAVDLPAWLEIHSLDDLKSKLISVVIAVLSVLFLGTVIEKSEPMSIALTGAGIGIVIAALAFFLRSAHVAEKAEHAAQPPAEETTGH